MQAIDMRYLCKTIGNLSGIPVRIYEDGRLVFYHSMVELPRDPIELFEKEIFRISDHVG